MKRAFLKIGKLVWRHKFATFVILFVMWLTFFAEHSIWEIQKINHQQQMLQHEITEFKDSIRHYQELIDDVSGNTEELEHFAREKMRMKKENEDVFLIED